MSNGFRSVAAQFTAVGSVSKGFWLSGAVINGAAQHTGSVNPVELQMLKPDGTVNIDYSFTYHKGDTSYYYKNFNGWYNAAKKAVKADTATDVFFPVGTGLWLSGTDTTLSFQTSGEVVMDTVQCNLTNGFVMIANPYPVAIKLSSIEILGAEQHTGSVNPVELQMLKTDGTVNIDFSFTYHKGDTSYYYKNFNGWYNAAKKPIKPDTATEVMIPAGAAVWVSSSSNDFKIVIPTPFEDAE